MGLVQPPPASAFLYIVLLRPGVEINGAVLWVLHAYCELQQTGKGLLRDCSIQRRIYSVRSVGSALLQMCCVCPEMRCILTPGLYQVGDSTAPGIGVPAVAASGMICANTIVPFSEHSALLQDMSKKKVFPQ